MKAKFGISPIAWWNDDLEELSDDVSLEECLSQASAAGYTGMEMGRRFPTDPAILSPILAAHNIRVCGGWHSGRLLERGVEEEKDAIAPMLALFQSMDAPCIVYGEVASSIQGDRSAPLASKRCLSSEVMQAYGARLTEFAQWLSDQGMPLAYHHHMAAVVETEPELDALMAATGPALRLLFDAGHMAFAGGDPLSVIDKHHKRIAHVHTKDIRADVIAGLDRSTASFLDAVIAGAFTVPGDGSLDFDAITRRLAHHGYEGWFVVEAEQDPAKAPPLEMARIGHTELLRVMAAAGYTVEA